MAKQTGARGRVDTTKLRKSLAKLGVARRAVRGLKATTATRSVGEQISKLAGKRGMVVEWTLRPVEASETASVSCYCGCACGCSCIA